MNASAGDKAILGADQSNLSGSFFGELMRHYRQQKGNLTQADLAEKLRPKFGKIGQSQISRYETGGVKITADFVFEVARCLELTASETTALVYARIGDDALKLMRDLQKLLESRGAEEGK